MADAAKKPKYRVIAEFLRERILDGTYVAGQALPGEEVLAKEFGVTRPTVRQGISELRAAGLVEASMGRGTFVRSPHARPNITRPRGLRREQDGRYVEADAIRWTSHGEPTATRTDAPMALADMLRIPPGEPMFTYDEVHTAEHGRLRQTHRTYIPFSVLVGTRYEETAPPPAPALFTALEAAGHELHWVEHVRTRMPMPDEATTLRLAEGVPLFQLFRVTYNQRERPLVLEEFKLPGDDLEMTFLYA